MVSWFDRHRAKAIAWSQIGFSVGGLCVPLIAIGIETLGWRTMALISGGAVLLLAGPLVQLVRHRPEEIGEVPDGAPRPPAADGTEAPPAISLTARQAMREPSFWLISAGHALSLLTVSSILMHLIPHLRDLHFTKVAQQLLPIF